MWVLSVEGIAAQRKVKGECIWNRRQRCLRGQVAEESKCNSPPSSLSGSQEAWGWSLEAADIRSQDKDCKVFLRVFQIGNIVTCMFWILNQESPPAPDYQPGELLVLLPGNNGSDHLCPSRERIYMYVTKCGIIKIYKFGLCPWFLAQSA